jgi:hypothetical protein
MSRSELNDREKSFRRDVLKGALMGVAAVPVSALPSRAGRQQVDPAAAGEPGYVEDATKVDRRAELQAGAGLRELPAGPAEQGAPVPCNIFAGRKSRQRAGARVVKRP